MIVSGAMGFCSVEAQLIAVSEDQPNDAMQDTFLHEVMHALTAAFYLKEKDKEESFVRRLATGLHGVERQPECVQVVEGAGCHQLRSRGTYLYSNNAPTNPITKYHIKAM